MFEDKAGAYPKVNNFQAYQVFTRLRSTAVQIRLSPTPLTRILKFFNLLDPIIMTTSMYTLDQGLSYQLICVKLENMIRFIRVFVLVWDLCYKSFSEMIVPVLRIYHVGNNPKSNNPKNKHKFCRA
jgi:hypothetical protein